jgi:bifunctional enzyme CysN/CysC
VLPSAKKSKIARILTPGGDVQEAAAGKALMVTLTGEVDVGRGDMICAAHDRAEVTDQFQASLVWMSDKHLLKGRPLVIRAGTQSAIAQISEIKYKLNVETLEHVACKDLELNEIGVVNVSVSKPLVLDPYETNRETGSFILIDRVTNETVGAGMVQFALRRSNNIHWQAVDISKRQRSEIKGQKACCLWFTGLSGSGKSTISNLLEKRLFSLGRHTYILDGDNVRHGLNRDLGFTEADRVENIRRVSEVARLMVDAGLVTLVSFISPFRAERQFARERFEAGEFLEVFVDTPIEVCEERDVKGLYKKARAGQIANFTGISSPYEPPLAPDMVLASATSSPEAAVDQIIRELERRGVV